MKKFLRAEETGYDRDSTGYENYDIRNYSKAAVTTHILDDADKIIYELWKIIDDIDTASDMFKENYEYFAKSVYNKQQERWKILSGNDVEKLYDKYHTMPE